MNTSTDFSDKPVHRSDIDEEQHIDSKEVADYKQRQKAQETNKHQLQSGGGDTTAIKNVTKSGNTVSYEYADGTKRTSTYKDAASASKGYNNAVNRVNKEADAAEQKKKKETAQPKDKK